MKRTSIIILILIVSLHQVTANSGFIYRSLDQNRPIEFDGRTIKYEGKTIELNDHSYFVDGQLSDEEVSCSPFVFNSLNRALEKIRNGSEETPMSIYMAPYVYWVDDPDDPAIRKPETGGMPFGQVINCNWLSFIGLTNNPENVVMACNRGQTQGAIGNFTMFYFNGDGIRFENVTLGNYCNVDLDFPLKPELNREKRATAIVQAQLALCNSDKVVAQNSRFISRLNSCPMVGAKRALFQDCYFECTDDAIGGTGVYQHCRFTFFSSKPFYSTHGTGAVFLDCDIDILSADRQYFVKVGNPVTLIDCRLTHQNDSLYIGWTNNPTRSLRCYQYHVTLNGQPVKLQPDFPEVTVELEGKEAINAFRVEKDGKVEYNIFNLMRGNDNWNPTQMEPLTLHNPTRIFCTPRVTLESGITQTKLEAKVQRFYMIESQEEITWEVQSRETGLIDLRPGEYGTCQIVGNNQGEEPVDVMVLARTTSGLEAACQVTVLPKFIDPPKFITLPVINTNNHQLKLDYQLDLQGRSDQSLISWFRCTDREGHSPIEVSTSRLNQPETNYNLEPADVGYYLMATIRPKHLRCQAGQEVKIMSEKITEEMIEDRPFITDFQNFPTTWQPLVIPGFWTVDCYKPIDTREFEWEATTGKPSWIYDKGTDNAKGYGLLQATKGARLLYTPIKPNCGNMSVHLEVSPSKSAGQGFGSATGQYLDLCIKFDTQTLTGYALRIIRTTKYDHAVDFLLIRYENGQTTPLTEPVSSTCFLTKCLIDVEVIGNRLKASARTTVPQNRNPSNLPHSVDLETVITPVPYSGLAIQHTGSTGASATMLNKLEVHWDN